MHYFFEVPVATVLVMEAAAFVCLLFVLDLVRGLLKAVRRAWQRRRLFDAIELAAEAFGSPIAWDGAFSIANFQNAWRFRHGSTPTGDAVRRMLATIPQHVEQLSPGDCHYRVVGSWAEKMRPLVWERKGSLVSTPLIALALLLLASPAHAATASDVAASLVSQVAFYVIAGLMALLGMVLLAHWTGAVDWFKAHTDLAGHAKANAIKNRFIDVLAVFVKAELQTAVGGIKADFAAGKLTPAQYKNELATVKQRAIASATQQASRENLTADLQQVLGVTSLDQFAGTAVEAILAEIKAAKATPVTPASTPATPPATPATASATPVPAAVGG